MVILQNNKVYKKGDYDRDLLFTVRIFAFHPNHDTQIV